MRLNPSKIVQTIKNLDIGNLGGGAERFAIDLGVSLLNEGWDVDVFIFFRTNTEAEKKWIKKISDKGIPVYFGTDWRGHNHPITFTKATKAFHAYLDETRPQLIHSHFQLGTVAGIWWKRKNPGARVVRTAHLASEWEGGLIGLAKSTYASHLYRRFLDAEAGVSKTITQKLQQEAKTGSITKQLYIPNGINLRIKTADEIPPRDVIVKTLGSVGRLTEQKGYCYLIDAMSIVLRQLPELNLILVGDGELREELKAQAQKLGISERIYFTGLVDNVQYYYDQMDLFVSSSLWEGLPTVLMEAMAAGIPVVTTDIPGSNDLVQGGVSGWLADMKSPESLAEAILEGCARPDKRREFALAGLEVARKYSMTEIAKQYTGLYRCIVSEKQ